MRIQTARLRAPAALVAALGHKSALQEFKWMAQAVSDRSVSHSLASMVERRARGEPLQYILGSQPFGPLSIIVRAPVLIPRPETEEWTLRLVDEMRERVRGMKRPLSVLDLCTGTGCIPLLMCRLMPPGSIHTYGVDVSTEAVDLATENARQCNPDNGNSFTPLQLDMLAPSFLSNLLSRTRDHAPFDIITANPPYIPQCEYDELPSSVKDYEDPRALLGDPSSTHGSGSSDLPEDGGHTDGLTFYRAITRLASHSTCLRPSSSPLSPALVLEVGAGQAQSVRNIVQTGIGQVAGWGNGKCEVWRDAWDVERTRWSATLHDARTDAELPTPQSSRRVVRMFATFQLCTSLPSGFRDFGFNDTLAIMSLSSMTSPSTADTIKDFNFKNAMRNDIITNPEANSTNAALTKWLDHWRTLIYHWSLWAMDIANHPPGRLADNWFVIEIERRPDPPSKHANFQLVGGAVMDWKRFEEVIRDDLKCPPKLVQERMNDRRGDNTVQITVICHSMVRFIWYGLQEPALQALREKPEFGHFLAKDWVQKLSDIIDSGDVALSDKFKLAAAIQAESASRALVKR
ncbi:hypothetical protein PLICRDRAFT_27757 [Plicaturopsis crispa FD-325 SS-3]|nr:hypothetical protein PLICRDRAFT_27757 [Plicaturopsis crispa FD-325 SS-3]